MAAMNTKDVQTFGKYLSTPGNFFSSWPPAPGPTQEYLQAMQEIGGVRQDTNTRALAFILDALAPSILAALSSHTKASLEDSNEPDQPSFDESMESVGRHCECLLMPRAGVSLEAGKERMRRKTEEVQAQFTERSSQ
jgi:hypothetical protein